MNKQKRFSYNKRTNIFDMMKDRQLCFDGGSHKSPLKQSSDFEPSNMISKRFSHLKTKVRCKDDRVKQMTRAQMIKYLKAYKTNYELLSFVLQPKFRPPPQVLPVIELKPKKPKPHSCFFSARNDQPHPYVTQHSRSPSSSTTLQSGRHKSVNCQSKIKRSTNPHFPPLKATYNCASFSGKMTHGLPQQPANSLETLRSTKRRLHCLPVEHNQEIFYDIECSSHSY